MTAAKAHSEIVEAEGHLIDSQLLNLIFDAVIRNGASFEVRQKTWTLRAGSNSL